LSLDKL